jgi:hypothetical protein
MDLPCDDPAASLDDYADVVCDALTGCDDDVVLVGRSLAGHTIPLVAARRPVRQLIFLCSVLPKVGSSLMEQAADDPDISKRWFAKLLRTGSGGHDSASDLVFLN